MINNKSLADLARDILSAQREIKKQYPGLEPPKPDQREMDKLASALTEAVLQLRAGDMDGARATLNDANGLCDVTLRGSHFQIPDHYMDAAKYGMGMAQYRQQSATEQLLKHQIAEQQMRRIMTDADPTTFLSHILSDNTVDPTDSGV